MPYNGVGRGSCLPAWDATARLARKCSAHIHASAVPTYMLRLDLNWHRPLCRKMVYVPRAGHQQRLLPASHHEQTQLWDCSQWRRLPRRHSGTGLCQVSRQPAAPVCTQSAAARLSGQYHQYHQYHQRWLGCGATLSVLGLPSLQIP